MSGLYYKNITKRLGEDAEFNNFSLAVDNGEFVALVGKNGCGKAELIRMAEGFGGGHDGDVIIDGRRVTYSSRGHHMASLLSDVPIIGTPRREMTRILKKQGLDRRDIVERIEEAAELTGITDVLDVRYSKLDPEQLLRAGMARAYAARAKVALMIDPFMGIDFRMAARMRIAVMEFRAKTDMIFVMSTNSPMSALTMATRVVVMDEGRIIQSDTAQNIYDYPSERFVAEYFGAAIINMIPAKLERVGEQVHAVFGDTRVLVPAGKIDKLVDQSYIGKKILLGVRPENIHYEQLFLSLSPESSFEAMVRHIGIMGSETYLHLELDGVDDYITARVDPRCIAIVGHSIALAIDSNRLHMFDIDTGKSILSKL